MKNLEIAPEALAIEDIKHGRLPEPVKIGRNNYWAEDVINNWIDELQSKSHEE